ncbi:DUF4294 domain-containing protein [Flavobacterium aurantiibacter]|uniref:DUF4294 domain-containing protein n=1 Tax=Flavobacterium aurantiibacter TaxID=2023067 RepID=A0A255ZPU9_9FLAO|nr:DUF4294 domain-containing protein [Flavobacterium aurantiibacter]OYQ43528.1 hypothetical protein CHX27_09815 [Flavobacterium aurantiibacter]
MRWNLFFVLLLSGTTAVFAQEDPRDAYLNTPDSLNIPIELEEVVINPNEVTVDAEAVKIYNRLQRRVYKVYPYAKATSATLLSLNEGMSKMKTARERRKYFKIVEDYMQKQFEPQLKKLSRKDGQILVKLIHRQTGQTTFDLIKEYKSGWKAFWSNNTARMFDINLKTKYAPYEVNEDYLIETIIVRGVKAKRLDPQEPKVVVNYDDLSAYWIKKLRAERKKKT